MVLLILAGAIVGGAYFLPSSYSVEQSMEIDASPQKVYQAAVDLEVWQKWHPWKDEDPDMTVSYGTTRRGLGAEYFWESETTGNGQMKIVKVEPNRLIEYELLFEGEPLPSFSSIQIEPIDDGKRSLVTWDFSGSWGDRVLIRYMNFLIEPMVSTSYEKGLENLNELLKTSS